MHLGPYVVSLFLLLPAGAAEPVTPDFGPGLAKIAALGLPDMKGAEWIKPPKNAQSGFESSYEFRELSIKMQGGAWKTPGDPPRIIGFASRDELVTGDEADAGPKAEAPAGEPGLLEKMLRKHAASQPPKETKPKPVPSLDEDVKQLVDALAKPNTAAEMAQQAEYGRATLPGRILIFAAQLHAAGKTDAANRVAGAVFAAIPEKTAVIDAAIHHFAENDYQKLTAAFFETRDWKAYHEGLKSLLEKYPRGWADATAVALLLPGVETRAAGKSPAPPSLPGIELKPDALDALAKLLDPPAADARDDQALAESEGIDLNRFPAEQRRMILAQLRSQGMSAEFHGGLWLLVDEENGEGDPSGPAAALIKLGMDGLIALAAVATDDTLTYARNSSGGSSYYGSSQSAEQIALSRYRDLDRPKTRGEIARELLAAVVPAGEAEDRGEIDPETLRDNAVAFWKNHRTKSLLELALFYLAEGDEAQRQYASQHLAGSADPAARPAFEKAVLTSETPADFASTVEDYLDRHKADAKPFFDAYSKILKEAFEGMDVREMGYSSGTYAIREAGGVEKYLKTLSMKVGAVSLKELVADAMKSGEDSDITGLRSAMNGAGSLESLTAVGEVAGKATPDQLSQLLMILLQGSYQEYDPDSDEELPPVTLPAATLDLWRPLLAKTDLLPEESSLGRWATAYGAKTIADGVALVLEVCAFPASVTGFNGYGDIQGSLGTVAPFVKTRVEAWINGKEAPPWPDESKVGDARKEEIATQLAKLPVAGIPAFAMALPLDERAALATLVGNYDEENPAPPSILELRTRVVSRKDFKLTPTDTETILDQLGILEGSQFSQTSLVALAERMGTEAAKFSGIEVMFRPAPMGLGSIAMAARFKASEKGVSPSGLMLTRWFQHYTDQNTLAMLALSNTSDFWGLKDGKVTKLEALRPADETLKEAFESKSAELPFISVQVMTRADADKLNQEDE